ncbi:hypothetical protein NIES2104_16920 [Leptolyngbya sp. NIES-2104]|nr:hypothetical protein NIES2104_16920 [Leptolyngbya sp. NIES-2104]
MTRFFTGFDRFFLILTVGRASCLPPQFRNSTERTYKDFMKRFAIDPQFRQNA